MTTTQAPPGHAPEAAEAGPVGWITTVDHKRIGLLYMVTALLFFLVGGVLAMLIRAELFEPGQQVLGQVAYNATFTMHGTLMIFLFSVPIFTGLGNYLVPLQIGAADVAFPRLNALGFWLFAFGGLVVVAGWAFGAAPCSSAGSPTRRCRWMSTRVGSAPTCGSSAWP